MKAKAEFIGRITRDPETKKVGKNDLCTFSIACNRKIKGETEAMFFDLEAWGQPGEYIVQYAKKGDPVALDAELRVDKWQDEQGKTRSKVKFVVVPYTFTFLPSGAPKDGIASAGGEDDEPPF